MLSLLSVLLATPLFAAQQTAGTVVVDVDKPGVRISPSFYGLMTEEINHAYDGGLYGELIRNRSFRDSATAPARWSLVTTGSGKGDISLDAGPALKLEVASAGPGDRVGVANGGYWGIPVTPRTRYRATIEAKVSPGFSGLLTVTLEKTDGSATLATAEIRPGPDWRRYAVDLRTGDVPVSKDNRFVLSAQTPGTVWIRYASLFPPTYKGRPNGNRIDLMEKLGGLNPSFLRLPGGNYLEGDTIPDRFEWKDTLGDPAERKGHQGPWGYRSSDGLGLLEYLEWCEDLHMDPVLAVYAGYSLQQHHVAPGPDLAPYVQDALDEIEYTIGDASTKWGAVRAKSGHPKPFPLTYVEIGNEDEFDQSRSYDGRFTQFYDAIKARYPSLQVIATARVRSRTPDVVDDHYYYPAVWMERNSDHYDKMRRSGPKIFVGEWASVEGSPTPFLKSALGDAAWLIGLERNSDLVVMESYAPLLVNVNPGAAQWGTNLIGYDALTSFGSPSYWVQSMFGQNPGKYVLPARVQLDLKPPAPEPPHGAIGLASFQTKVEYKDVEVTNSSGALYSKDFSAGASDWTLGNGTWAAENGVLAQTSMRRNTFASAGDRKWTDYTLRLKARRTAGDEGFMILFHVRDRENYWRWNVGGWSNTQSALERIQDGSTDQVGEPTPTTIENGRWYDVKVEVQGKHVRCYLDGKLVTETDESPRPPADPIYVGAVRAASGDVILKVVNVTERPMPLDVDLNGTSRVASGASGWVLTGQPDDQNSVENPNKVAPRRMVISGVGPRFSHTFEPYSVTVLRLKVR